MGTQGVKQRTGSDCCVAAVANAAGKSYAAVKRTCGPIRGGLQYHELVWLLGEFGEWKETRPRKHPTLDDWAARNTKGRFVVILRSGFLDDFHAVAVVDGAIMGHYSPEWPVTNYFRREV
jgi:hypothetical protein